MINIKNQNFLRKRMLKSIIVLCVLFSPVPNFSSDVKNPQPVLNRISVEGEARPGEVINITLHGSGLGQIAGIDQVRVGDYTVSVLKYIVKSDSVADAVIRLPKEISPGTLKLAVQVSSKSGVSWLAPEPVVPKSYGRRVDYRNREVSAEQIVPTEFSKITFDKSATFTSSKFSKTADFSSTNFDSLADFKEAEFNYSALFNDAEFRNMAFFNDANFSSLALFSNAKFKERADFSLAKFSGKVQFGNASFDTVIFKGVDFDNAVDFKKVTFQGTTVFNETRFDSLADFSKAEFNGPADLRRVIFSGTVNFNSAVINNKLDFRNSQLDSVVDFSRANIRDTLVIGSQDSDRANPQKYDFSRANLFSMTKMIAPGNRPGKRSDYPGARIVLFGPVELKMQVEKLKFLHLCDTLDYFSKKEIISHLKEKSFTGEQNSNERFELDYILAKSTIYQKPTAAFEEYAWYTPVHLGQWLYKASMELGYRPFKLIYWIAVINFLFAFVYIFRPRMRQQVNRYIAGAGQKTKIKQDSFSDSFINILYFSFMLFFTFRLRQDLLTSFETWEKRVVVFHWLLGFSVYISFITFSKAGSVLHTLKSLFVG